MFQILKKKLLEASRGILSCLSLRNKRLWKQHSTKNQRFKRKHDRRICSKNRTVGRKTPQLFVLLFLSLPALASDFYFVGGVGSTQHTKTGNGVWYQQGFEHSIDDRSPSISLGFGAKLHPNLSVEALYHDFGKTRMSADFVSPDAVYNDSSPNHCNGPCPAFHHGEGTGTAKGISLSLLPEYTFGEVTVFARVGMIAYRTEWREVISCCVLDGKPIAFHAPFVWQGDVGEGGDVTPKSKGTAPLFGLGLKWRGLALEVREAKFRALGSGFSGVRETVLSYQVKF